MFLSFIVPVYNAEKYIAECLESLLSQDISHEDYEIICVNDGSKDKSLDILNEYGSRYSSIRVIDKENGGVSSARNAGIDAATGDWIWFVDADDFIGKNVLGALESAVKEEAVDILQFGTYPFDSKLSAEEVQQYESGNLKPKSYANNVFVTRNMFRSAFINHHRIRFREELDYAEDKVFVCETLANAPIVKRTNLTCYYYRYHVGQMISRRDAVALEKKLSMWKLSISSYQKAYEKAPAVHKTAIADDLMSEVYHCVYTLSGLPPKQYRELKAQLKAAGILDIKRPKECTLTKSYLVENKGLAGKVFDLTYVHLDSWFGRISMRCIRTLRRIIKRI